MPPAAKRRPKALHKGDRIAVVSPASAVRAKQSLDAGIARLRRLGFRPQLMPHALASLDYPSKGQLAGSDDDRLADLQAAISDPQWRGIFCTRGGYGVTRLLERIDFAPLRKDPKPVLGYSDITALLAAQWKSAGVVGFHGPMVATTEKFASGRDCAALQDALVTDTRHAPELPRMGTPHVICPGQSEGVLVGGNLSLVVALIGTPWEIDTHGAILFLEDVDEAPYSIDRMLTQLLQTGALRHARGVVLGDFHLDETPLASESPRVVRVLRDRLSALSCPVAHGFPFGHRPRAWTLPFGGRARLDAGDEGKPAALVLLEPAVV